MAEPQRPLQRAVAQPVGRARQLRARLRSYFAGGRQRPAVEAALGALERVEWRETGSELEAALEEQRLLRELRQDGIAGSVDEELRSALGQAKGVRAQQRMREAGEAFKRGRFDDSVLGEHRDEESVQRVLQFLRDKLQPPAR